MPNIPKDLLGFDIDPEAKLIHFYHVFADNRDHYADTPEDAMEAFQKFVDEGECRIRLYSVVGEEETCTDHFEDVLMSYGDYPW